MNIAMEHALRCETAWVLAQTTNDTRSIYQALVSARDEAIDIIRGANIEEERVSLRFIDNSLLLIIDRLGEPEFRIN